MRRSTSTRRFGRLRIAAAAAAAAAVGVATALLTGSVPARAFSATPADTAPAASLPITVHPDQLGKHLLPGFVGLSFGAATLAKDDYASTDLGGVGITGPDAETNHSSWLGSFAALEAGHPDVTEISDHTYPASVCGTSTSTIPQLLGTGAQQYETANAQAALNAAGCDPYTPLCPTTGDLTVRPIYYGLLATELVGDGRFAALDNPDAPDMRAYALRHGHTLTAVLDNVQDPATSGATTVTVNLGGDFCSGRLTALTTSSPAGLSATTDITLGGQQVGAHGAFPSPQSTPVAVHNQSAVVTVPAGSAAIVHFG